jgi:cysteine synthase/rhodanese-related sulfurtransferase
MTDTTLRVYDSVLDMLSGPDNPTPLVRLRRVIPFRHTQVWAKLEWYNPFGAVKDRVAANLVRDAEERGVRLEHLVEPTSGNTGMGLAMIANAKGLEFTATLSLAIPVEKRSSLRLFGADLVELADDLCPMPGAPEGAMAKATELGAREGWHQLNQYKNPANPDAHMRTTGPEIWRQTGGAVTHFVAGLGTCGTITGCGRFLRSKKADLRVHGVHPAEGHDIPGVRSLRQLKLADFFFPNEYDGLAEVSNDDAYRMCKRLNQEESLVAGPSSGMALVGALRMIPDEPGAVCVVIFPDSAFKYSSSFRKHLPELFGQTGAEAAPPAPVPEVLQSVQALALESPDVIDPAEALRAARAGAVLLDVRSPDEFGAGHIDGAVNVVLSALSRPGAAGLPADRARPIVTVCAVGKRSLTAMILLKAQGYQRVQNLRGGLQAWKAAGLPPSIR